MTLPGCFSLLVQDTHRLIPSKYSGDGVLKRIADTDSHLEDLFALDNATNDRLQGEMDLLPGIGRDELVAGHEDGRDGLVAGRRGRLPLII